MSKSPVTKKRRRARIVPIAILVGAVGASASVIPACQDESGLSDMASDIGVPDDWRYPHDVSAHGFFDLANPDLTKPDDGGSSD